MLPLNAEQQQAVDHIEGPLLVLAGAGSGKTRVVTQRIVRLLHRGIPESEILAVTFTNKAAREMAARIAEQASGRVLTCTFHRFAVRVLRESIHHLQYGNDFTIYDAEDALRLLQECCRALDLEMERGDLKRIYGRISYCKSHLLQPEDVVEQRLATIYRHYQQRLKQSGALDFDDLLLCVVQLWRRFPAVCQLYQTRYRFVLIDEYQDTNPVQDMLVKMLVAGHGNLFAVGDPDQSIYSWRGAHVQNILNFKTDYPAARVIFLQQNYRSTTHILEGANALIRHNSTRYEKTLWSQRGSGDKIGLYLARNEHEEVQFALQRIAKHHQEGVALRDAVIFYRTHAQSRLFEDACLKRQIPYRVMGGLSFYQRKEVKDFLCYLRLVQGDSDVLAFTRTINLPKRGIGPVAIEKIRQLADAQQLPILEACRLLIAGQVSASLSRRQLAGLGEYVAGIDAVRQRLQQGMSLHQVLQAALEAMRYLEVLRLDAATCSERQANLMEVVNKAAEWSPGEGEPLQSFLEDASLRSGEDGESEEGLRLMTIHNGKGLEFAVVVLVGMEEGLFPHGNALDKAEQLEEERRLCYVGMTRAKRHLYLCTAAWRALWGVAKRMRQSRFLQEIPRQHLAVHAPLSTAGIASSGGHFAPGERIVHHSLGRGIIRKVYQTSSGLTYEIFFPQRQRAYALVARYVDGALRSERLCSK